MKHIDLKKQNLNAWLKAVLATTILIFNVTGWSENTHSIQISAEQIANLGVQLGKLEVVNETPLLTAPARVVVPPEHEYIVSTSQAGLISRLTAAIGQSVKQGALLAQINSPDVLALQGRYLKASSSLKLAAAMYERDKKLLKEGVIATRREQETLSQYNQSVLDVNETKQLLAIAGMSNADIKKLEANHQLNSTVNVYAPMTGVVIERMAALGTRIDALATLYKLADLSELWLEINIPQERLQNVDVGHLVSIENTEIIARISHVGHSVNPENQTVLARAIIQGQQSNIRPGQRVNIKISQVSDDLTFKIPNTAIAQNEGQSFIFIRNKTGFAVTPITVIGKQGDDSTISGVFTGDEAIAVKGAVALKANWLGLGSEE